MTENNNDSAPATGDEAAPAAERTTPPAATAPPPPPPPAAAPPRPGRSAAPVAWLALLVGAAALGAVVFQAYQDRIEADLADFRIQSSLQDQVGAINQLQQRLADQRANTRSLGQQWQEGQRKLEEELGQLRLQLGEVQRADRSAWQLAEAEYLLQLASQRLLLGRDAHSALQMLQQVDEAVAALGDPAALSLRTALADDMAALKAVPTLDLEGTYLAIDAAARRARELRLIRPQELPEVGADAADVQTASWRERLESSIANAFARLGELVQIRRSDQPFRASLAPEHEAALRHNLQLLFEQAQLALLAGNQRLYEQSLAKAREWLLAYYSLDEAAAQALAATVNELGAQAVTRQLPDIDASRRALKQYVDGRLRSAPAPAPAQQAEPAEPAPPPEPVAEGEEVTP